MPRPPVTPSRTIAVHVNRRNPCDLPLVVSFASCVCAFAYSPRNAGGRFSPIAMRPVERCFDEPMRSLGLYGMTCDAPRWANHHIAPFWPYWRRADNAFFPKVGNQTKEFINDKKKFAVSLDVSHFKPEELKVELEGRDLTIEGVQEVKTDHGYTKKSFVHKWALPEDCDLDAVHTQIDNEGHLTVEAPKTGEHTKTRVLPIMPAPKKK